MLGPKVCVIIVNWNKKDYVLRLLEALRHIDYNNYDVVVVDNASTDGSAEAIREKFPEVLLIQNKENLGGTGGFNTGMRYALKKGEYKYIWLLDNDVMVERDTLIELVKVMEADEKIGICGCTIYDYENRNFVIETGSFIDEKCRLHGFCGENVKLSNEPLKVDFVVTCSALVRLKAAKSVGFMDQRYFLYWDDIDFSVTLNRKGYKVVSNPKALAYHKPFLPGDRPLNFYYEFRNRLLFISKHYNSWQRVRPLFRCLRIMTKILIYSLLQRRKNDVLKIVFAIKDFTKNKWTSRNFSNDKIYSNKIKIHELFREIYRENIKLLILPSGNSHEINELLSHLSQIKSNFKKQFYIYLLIQKIRIPLIKTYLCDKLIVEDFSNTRFPLIKMFFYFLKVTFSKFNFAIDTAQREVLVYYYAIPRVYQWDAKTKFLYKAKESFLKFWKLPFAFILGEISAFVLFPLVFIKSFGYKVKQD